MSKFTRRSVRIGALVGVALLGSTALGLPVVSAESAPEVRAADARATPAVQWGPCPPATVAKMPADQVAKFSCANYRVPIDHDNAALGTIDIALLRRAAAKPEQKIGSLFLNPGGPGGPGLTMPISAGSFFNPEVLDRFDLVGFDPRGVGASNPLKCFTTAEDANSVLKNEIGVPLSREEISLTLAAFRDYGQLCKNNSGMLMNHMSTKDVVRDLDLLRAAVGDTKLNFVGFSYGTLVGATYANMFPKSTRAIVIDGNVDPELRTRDGLEYDRQRAQGFELSLNAFLAACKKAGPQCGFSSGQPREKFDELRTYLRNQPIKLPNGATITISAFTASISGAMYSPSTFRALASDLQTIYDVVHPPATPVAKKFSATDLSIVLNPPNASHFEAGQDSARDNAQGSAQDSAYVNDDSYLGVNCLDKKFSHRQEELPAIAAKWEQESPTFGRTQAFSDPAGCPVWPVKNPDVYRGPWHNATENPVVVVGNYYDPATQYIFAQRMAAELGYARLVSVDAFGHCILGDSTGVDKIVSEYLIDLKAPAPGQVFEPKTQPFAPLPAG